MTKTESDKSDINEKLKPYRAAFGLTLLQFLGGIAILAGVMTAIYYYFIQ